MPLFESRDEAFRAPWTALTAVLFACRIRNTMHPDFCEITALLDSMLQSRMPLSGEAADPSRLDHTVMGMPCCAEGAHEASLGTTNQNYSSPSSSTCSTLR